MDGGCLAGAENAGRALWLAVAVAATLVAGSTRSTADGRDPRFAALRADEVNLRTGPGMRYPVDWVYKRRNLPVQIVSEFDTWRQIRDSSGTMGWIHKSMLTGRRTVIVVGRRQPVRREPGPAAKILAYVEPNVIARLLRCEGRWCGIDVAGYKGWVRQSALWGVGPKGAER